MKGTTMKVSTCFSVAAAAVLASSCAAAGGDAHSIKKMLADTTGQNGRACIKKTDIRSFGVLKGDIVSIDGTRHYYLATVFPGCTDLQTSMRAYFSSDFFEVCGGKNDKMVTESNQCTINRIYEFKNRDEAFSTYHAVLEKRKEAKNKTE